MQAGATAGSSPFFRALETADMRRRNQNLIAVAVATVAVAFTAGGTGLAGAHPGSKHVPCGKNKARHTNCGKHKGQLKHHDFGETGATGATGAEGHGHGD